MIDDQLVDSNERTLTPIEVVFIAANSQGLSEQVTPEQVYAAISAEISDGNGFAITQGNTLFIVHPSDEDPGIALFRALNADLPQNYVENGKIFIQLMQMNGYHTLVTQYEDERISKVLHMIEATGQDSYDPSTQMEIYQHPDGMFEAVIYMQGSSVGQEEGAA